MMKTKAVYVVGPDGLRDLPNQMSEFEICAVVDPTARGTRCRVTGLRAYRSAREAMSSTGASSLIYGDSYIDVNGVGELRPTAKVLAFRR
jgi:hypothetical protein